MEIQEIDTAKLQFDQDNPRFYRLGRSLEPKELISEMVEAEGVFDLMESIGIKGYFPGEPLLVIKDASGYTVVEGNRRLVAVKLLNSELEVPPRNKHTIGQIKEESLHKPTALPCVVCSDREAVMQYLGYRHVTGIKEWDALSKAYYVDKLIKNDNETSGYKEKLNKVSKMIGSRPDYLARLMAALKLYEFARRSNFFDLKIDPKFINFSLISTAISYINISEWLGLEDLHGDIEAQVNGENAKLMFQFLFVIRNDATSTIAESRQLSEFNHVAANPDAMQVLIDTGDLEAASLLTDGPAEALTNLLEKCSSSLRHAWGFLFDGKIEAPSDNHVDKAKDIRSQAGKLVDAMENSNRGDR